MAPRIDHFIGNQAEYIKYLEGLVVDFRSSSATDREPLISSSCSTAPVPSSLATFRWVHFGCEQRVFRVTPQDESDAPTDRLGTFLQSIKPASRWTESRSSAGMTSVERNRWMIRYLIDDPSLITATSQILFPAPVPSRTSELEHAHSYGRRKKDLKVDKKLINTVSEFGELVFIQWGRVMIKRGTYSADEVNDMMMEWFPLTASKNIRNCRCGGDWMSRVSSKLCVTPWGERAFELPAVHRRSLSALGKFADKMSESTERAIKYLTKPEYAQAIDREEGWITPCSPCIIKCLADQTYEEDGYYQLRDICSDLCFDEKATEMILTIWDREYLELYSHLRRARAYSTHESAEVGCLLSIAQLQAAKPSELSTAELHATLEAGQTALATRWEDNCSNGDQGLHNTPDAPGGYVQNANVPTPSAFDDLFNFDFESSVEPTNALEAF